MHSLLGLHKPWRMWVQDFVNEAGISDGDLYEDVDNDDECLNSKDSIIGTSVSVILKTPADRPNSKLLAE